MSRQSVVLGLLLVSSVSTAWLFADAPLRTRRGVHRLHSTAVDDWSSTASALASRYLQAKYVACDFDGMNCRALCDRAEITLLLKDILPPVSAEELEIEVRIVMRSFQSQDDTIDLSDFVEVVKRNKYWAEAGELVVKELIYLDCLQCQYVSKTALLSDEDYDELKDSLCWDGSALPGMSGQEARFLYAVASSRKGVDKMADSEYNSIKAKLQAQGSWVADRGAPDTLERLGLNTLLGYVHRSFRTNGR